MLGCAAPGAARADDVTAAELGDLVRRAPQDRSARDRLLRVDRVDGRPAAVRAALVGARGRAFEERARLLADGLAAGDPEPAAQARAQARDILAERRFRGASIPRPFQGVLGWLGDRLDPIADFLDDLEADLPGGGLTLYTVLAALVLLAAAALARRSIRHRAAAAARAARAGDGIEHDDPRTLERDAERAAADGDWERAVRLRFRAGLLRLDARDVIAYRPSLTTGEVASAVRSPAFERIGYDFDAIAYGGRPASEEDAVASREGWQRVLQEAGSR